ncbi:MAG: ribonuclease HII [Desulfobacterales bacterium]|nr:ribonuclease HII [Desulfobacterales bacterium]
MQRPVSRKLWSDPEHDPFSLERELRQQGYALVAGLDEVGRGPLAGPVVAAGVVLPVPCDYREFVDSKKISAPVRSRLRLELDRIGAVVAIGMATEEEIDRINILQASLLAMKRAVSAMPCLPDFLLVDGKFPVPIAIPQKSLIKGESKSASIAAASIAAKVFRDDLMHALHHQFPVYNFSGNKGYPTAEHRRALREHGPCAVHRRSFKGVTGG